MSVFVCKTGRERQSVGVAEMMPAFLPFRDSVKERAPG